jgi:hypothetical protein
MPPTTGGAPYERMSQSSAASPASTGLHIVALSNAWQTGAQQLDPTTRELFGNDPLNLQATDGPTNQAKGDAVTWLLPNRATWCHYVARQVAVKAKYGLWVTPAEHDAIARVLNGCPGEPLPS